MAQHYIPAEIEKYLKDNDIDLLDLIRESMKPAASAASTPKEAAPAPSVLSYCGRCGHRLQHPGADICFDCGSRQPARR